MQGWIEELMREYNRIKRLKLKQEKFRLLKQMNQMYKRIKQIDKKIKFECKVETKKITNL